MISKKHRVMAFILMAVGGYGYLLYGQMSIKSKEQLILSGPELIGFLLLLLIIGIGCIGLIAELCLSIYQNISIKMSKKNLNGKGCEAKSSSQEHQIQNGEEGK